VAWEKSPGGKTAAPQHKNTDSVQIVPETGMVAHYNDKSRAKQGTFHFYDVFVPFNG
jgi:hypothetical protein